MSVCSSETLIRDGELPKFNGKRIVSIYAVYENSRYATKEEGGGYIADILYYDCHVHKYDYQDWNGKRKGPAVLKVKNLPKEFDGMFGMVENKGARVFVTSHWFRTSGSGNGSFVDQSLDMDGWSANSTTGSFSLYRGIDNMNDEKKTYAISKDSELHNKWKKILGHSFKVKEVEFADCGYKMEEGTLDFATKYPYPHTPIRIIDGLVYPDEKLSSWRWLYGMPYRVPENKIQVLKHDGEIYVSPKSRESLRIWDENLNAHVYIEKAKDIEVGDTLISVSFSYESHKIYGSKGNAYCHIKRYIKEFGHEYVRHEVKKIVKDRETKKNKFVCDVYRNGEVVEKNKTYFGESFYRILMISNSDHKEV